jgi:hypothetical protein
MSPKKTPGVISGARDSEPRRRVARDLKFSVVVNEPGVVQILANVVHGR